MKLRWSLSVRLIIVLLLILAAITLLPLAGESSVVEHSSSGFLVSNRALIGATPDSIYLALTERIADWWDPAHTFSGDSRNLTLETVPGGCLCERLPDGGFVRHLTVVYASPGAILRLTGALGPLQDAGIAGSMTWQFKALDDSTAVELHYSAGGFFPGGLEQIAKPVDAVLRGQLLRLKNFVETGAAAPARADE